MTDELTKTFFDTFGIEPREISTGECKYKITSEFCDMDCLDCKNSIKETTYPQITSDILLGLICITTDEEPNIEWLKNSILQELIHRYKTDNFCNTDQAKHQVRTLFEEG